MPFQSILFEELPHVKTEFAERPDFFVDLNLDQVIGAVTAGKQEYRLEPFFYTPLNDVAAIEYRHEIFRDLGNKELFASINAFAHRMHAMREHLSQANKLYYKYHKERWLLETIDLYCDAVNSLAKDLSRANLKSRGLTAFRNYLTEYQNSERFQSLLTETKKLLTDLSTVNYCMLIKSSSIRVRRYESEVDYSAMVEETFEKFKQGAVKDYRVRFLEGPGDMNHVEAGVLDLVAKLYPDLFLQLDQYCAKNSHYVDEAIERFDREIQFYVAYFEFMATFKRLGLKFCYPVVSDRSKEIENHEGFDLALAHRLMTEKKSIVCNDFYLRGKERIIVVTGPNQGGKTTFARTFGQLHYLASLGCPVPGSEAKLFLYDRLFTHFEKEEDIKNLRGKLQDDLVRIHSILEQATSSSIIILNEIFTSTTLQDGIFLSKKVMEKIVELQSLCLWVTFIDELASFAEQTVSMVSTVVPENPTLRTYKIVRRPADGLAYAIALAEKYRLTYGALKERIRL